MPKKNPTTQMHSAPTESWFPDGGCPTWEIAYLFPAQGSWTEEEYLALDGLHSVHPLLELSNRRLEVLSMPTQIHQFIVLYLLELLKAHTATHAPGTVLFSGMRVRLRSGRFRAPDVLYMKAEHAHRRHEEHWDGADLVMEVVSPDPKDRKRDLVTKPREYAAAGIPEYWIVDPEEECVRVLTLKGKAYRVHGEFRPGSEATSVLLPGFTVSVDTALNPPGADEPE